MQPTILLFDIDGTLISTGGAGRRAIEHAFSELFGTAKWLDFPFGGMTDPSIVRQGLTAGGVSTEDDQIKRVLEIYLGVLPRELESANEFHVCNGVERALAAAQRADHCAVGLGTGNVERGARIKLAHGKLDQAFAFGGFGSDDEDRAELIRVGVERGAAHLGQPLADCRVVIIGDTPRDVAAARRNDAESVGVGTGGFSTEALRKCGATAVYADLSDDGAIEFLISGA